MTKDIGRSPDGSGSRPADRAAKGVSPVPASIPNAAALDKLRALRVMCAACGQPFYVEVIDEVLSAIAEEFALFRTLVSEASIEALASDIACAIVDPRSDVVAMRHSAMVRLGERLRNPNSIDLKRAAQGIEAQRAETVKQGSVHESPVRDSECAQNPSASRLGERPNE